MFPELFNDPNLFCYFLFFFFVSHVVNQNRRESTLYTQPRTTCKWLQSSNEVFKLSCHPEHAEEYYFDTSSPSGGKQTFLMCDPPRLVSAGRFYQQTRQARQSAD